MENQLGVKDQLFPLSPLAQSGEEEKDRIQRLLREGTVQDCLIESKYWLEYYLGIEDAELEPISTAMALHEQVLFLIESEKRELQEKKCILTPFAE